MALGQGLREHAHALGEEVHRDAAAVARHAHTAQAQAPAILAVSLVVVEEEQLVEGHIQTLPPSLKEKFNNT